MFDWLTKHLRGEAAPPRSRLRERLRDYPPFDPPHLGPASRWTDAQARENLAHVLAVRERRLAGLASWLDVEGIDLRPALGTGDWRPVLDALHRWANDTWPSVHDPRIATPEVWDRTSYRGEEVVYALTFDVALLIGEVVIRRDARCRWDVNFDEGDGRDGMDSYRRVVLAVDLPEGSVTEHVEGMVMHRYLHPASTLYRGHNGWAQMVSECLSQGLGSP
jgi:hypothetical protein